jgi:D-alanyl-lipoteichoic acid acyltransferase DltB (MBOAT superfamily)
MLFNSLEFALFLPITLAIYHLAIPRRHWRARKLFLVFASYLFYMSWNPFFGLLLLGSTFVDFTMGLALERTTHRHARRALLLVSLAFNLGMLGYFKYGNFFAANFHRWLGHTNPPMWDIILPVGISFYTFESLAYTINVYRGERASRSLLDFALFLSFFPHLVAGPIVRPRAFLPQLAGEAPTIPGREVEEALARIAQGLLKKVLLDDVLGQYVDHSWRDMAYLPAGNVALAFYAYAFQIYFDFSGYTDIALGVTRLFGLVLPENFDRPYLAQSPREFWQRWHISLSTWLRDYLYVSLGGNRRGPIRTYVNLMLTMLLGGLWHGAAWTFVIWGGYHGLLLVVHRLVARDRATPARGALGTALARIGMFHLVVIGWVFFRAPTLGDAMGAFLRLGVPGYAPIRVASEAAIVLVVGMLLHVAPPARRVREWFIGLSPVVQGTAYAAATIVAFFVAPASERFIYFQF